MTTSNGMTGPVFLIGRQPIFDRRLEVFGYELLYRASMDNFARGFDGDEATLTVFLYTFSQAGLTTLVGSKKAFINVTRNFLIGHFPIPLPADQIVLEILEDIVIDAELIYALNELYTDGYQFALDDINSAERIGPLFKLVNTVKIDLATVDFHKLPQLVNELKKHDLVLIAEKVETVEQYHLCRQLGFDYFQGYFFCRPEIVQGRKIQSSRLVALQALANLQKPDTSIEELERIIAMDVTLGYRLLKLVNSGYYSFLIEISSIRHAIALIGLNQLKRWLSLLLMTRFNDKPHELSLLGLLRARLAQSIALQRKALNPDEYFLAGLFSVLDAVLDLPMPQVVAGISISDVTAAALIQHAGPIGETLQAIIAMEKGSWDEILRLNISPQQINQLYLAAIQWTDELKKSVF